MLINISHQTRYDYRPAAKSAIQILHMWPRSHEGQYVKSWRIEVDNDCALRKGEDAFGNVTHVFDVGHPLEQLVVTVDGQVETEDRSGRVKGVFEPFPPPLFLRDTATTLPSAEIRDFAADCAADSEGGPLGALHSLMRRLNALMAFIPGATDVSTSARAAFDLKRGVCQDFAHIFIAAARSRDIPARYVSGYLFTPAGTQEASHAWAEAHVDCLGWIGFDAANGVCPTDAYVRMAVALDYFGAAPIRGARYGGSDEKLDVKVRVTDAAAQSQS